MRVMSATIERGDLVRVNNEEGVICSVDPPVMQTLGVRTYVPIYSWVPLSKGYDPECTIPEPVLGRIRAYLAKQTEDRPTGAAE